MAVTEDADLIAYAFTPNFDAGFGRAVTPSQIRLWVDCFQDGPARAGAA